jgi:hypothetical protein
MRNPPFYFLKSGIFQLSEKFFWLLLSWEKRIASGLIVIIQGLSEHFLVRLLTYPLFPMASPKPDLNING